MRRNLTSRFWSSISHPWMNAPHVLRIFVTFKPPRPIMHENSALVKRSRVNDDDDDGLLGSMGLIISSKIKTRPYLICI